MDFQEFLEAVRKTQRNEPYLPLRYGQAFFNALQIHKPLLAGAIRGTRLDPFHKDEVPEPTFEFVMRYWTRNQNNYTPALCDECGDPVLIETFSPGNHAPAHARDQYLQVQDGLCLSGFGGHYGGYTDKLDDSGLQYAVLCQQCSSDLAKAVPNVMRRFGE